jgi:hypothetical protein
MTNANAWKKLKEDPVKYARLRQYHRRWQNKGYARMKEEIFSGLGSKCSACGITDRRVLQIDHVNGGGGRQERIYMGSTNRMRQILREFHTNVKAFQLLCANCNWIKRYEKREGARVVGGPKDV